MHKFTPTVIKLKLFEGVKTFQELEDRICKQWNTIDHYGKRGYAFEVFTEGYLNLFRSKEVYSSEDIPQKIIEELRLTAHDIGVDGVYKKFVRNRTKNLTSS